MSCRDVVMSCVWRAVVVVHWWVEGDVTTASHWLPWRRLGDAVRQEEHRPSLHLLLQQRHVRTSACVDLWIHCSYALVHGSYALVCGSYAPLHITFAHVHLQKRDSTCTCTVNAKISDPAVTPWGIYPRVFYSVSIHSILICSDGKCVEQEIDAYRRDDSHEADFRMVAEMDHHKRHGQFISCIIHSYTHPHECTYTVVPSVIY